MHMLQQCKWFYYKPFMSYNTAYTTETNNNNSYRIINNNNSYRIIINNNNSTTKQKL